MIVPLFVGRDKSVAALEAAMAAEKEIFLVAQLDPAERRSGARRPVYDVGVTATVLQLLKLPDGTVRVLVEGKARATPRRNADRGRMRFLTADDRHRSIDLEAEGTETVAALMRSVVDPVRKLREAQQASCRAETSNQLVGDRRRG